MKPRIAPFDGHLMLIADRVDRMVLARSFADCKAAGEFHESSQLVHIGGGWVISTLSMEELEDLGACFEAIESQ